VPYVEFLPKPEIAHFVKCVWNYAADSADAAGRPERIVPDGNPELVIHYGHPFSEFTAAGKQQQPRGFLMGQMTRPLALDPSQGMPGIVGVRFWPAGTRTMFGAAMSEFTDERLALDDVVPGATARLVDQIASAANARERCGILQDFVAGVAAVNAPFQDAGVGHWVGQILNASGRISISALARESDLSQRQLERRFRAQVGVPPRLYANVIRFRTVFDNLSGASKPDWVDLALSAGYFDQSHMTKDFHRFLGCSPSQFISELRGLSAVLVGLDEETACRVITRRPSAA